MALNPVPTGARTAGMSNQLTAGGGYTAPQHAFIPHPATQPFAVGRVQSPGSIGGSNVFAGSGITQGNLPSTLGVTHGIVGSSRRQ